MTEFKEGKPCRRCGGTKRYAQCNACVSCRLMYLNTRGSSLGRRKTGDIGYAGELVVRIDLLMRGFDVMVPENRSTPDDVHFRSPSDGWVSVQVKVARVHPRTGRWTAHHKSPISSDILALVDLRSKTIRYQPNTKPVPPELVGDNNV